MKTLYTSQKPLLKTSPDHYFGLLGVVCFAYKENQLLYAKGLKSDETGVFQNKKLLQKIDQQNPETIYHSQLFKIYNEVTGKKENKENWTRGRTSPEKDAINLWGDVSQDEIQSILAALRNSNILVYKLSNLYEVGTVSKKGSKVYEVEAKEPSVQTTDHKIIRKHIYQKLGLESIQKFFSLLRESLKR